MRQIKFRGITLGGDVVAGLLSKSHQKKGSTPEPGFYISNSCGMPWAYAVRPETIGQFTGLRDKNEIDIYEGDILCSHMAQNEIKGVMNWDEDRAGWSNFKPLNRFHVIGNIYQHPELMEKES